MSTTSTDPTARRTSVKPTLNRRDLVRLAGAGTLLAGGLTTLPGLGVASATVQDGEVILNIRNRGEIVNLDPHLGSGNPDATIGENIYSKLVRTSPEAPLDPLPDLATDWQVSADGLEYRFNLRQGAQWHKGYGEVTADDVVWTYTRVRDPELGSRSTAEFAGVSDVVAEGPYTVIIRLKQADPTFLYSVLARVGTIGNQRAIEEKGEGYSSDPVGCGPYLFEEWVRGEQAVVAKFPDHWLHTGNVDRVVFKFLTDDTVAELSLRSGDLDMAYLETPEGQLAVLDNPDLEAIEQPAPRTHMLWMTMKEGTPLADPNVRRALAIGIDRGAIAEQALSGMASAAHSVYNQTMPGHDETEFFAYDPEGARQLLAEAGFGDGFDLEILGYNEGISPDLMTVAAAQWEEIGVRVTVTILERALLYERWRNRDFEMIEQPVARDTPEQIVYPYFTEAGAPYPNSALYTGIEELATSLRSEANPDERLRLIQAIQAKLVEDVAVIPTVNPKLVLAMRPDIDPFTLSIWYYPLWLVTVNQ